MDVGRVDYRSWLLRLVGWDAVLPMVIVLIPFGVEALFPNHRGAIELTAVVLPVVAFLLRVRAGNRHISSNSCGTATRYVQFFVFAVAIIPLAVFDSFTVLTHVMPKGAVFATEGDLVIGAVLFSVYLALMAIAMYPGRRTAPLPSEEVGAEEW